MAITSPYADMNPLSTDSTNISLVKIDAVLRELTTANTGATGITSANSAGTAAPSKVVKTSAGRLLHAGVSNTNAATRYLQLFDAVSLPANGTVPLASKAIAANDYNEISFDRHGLPFATGLVVALSTTQATLTIAGNDGLFLVTYF